MNEMNWLAKKARTLMLLVNSTDLLICQLDDSLSLTGMCKCASLHHLLRRALQGALITLMPDCS
jgi:hypothetical protein